MPFDVDQNYGDLPEEEMPLTFKDCVARDIEMVFFNLDEFAEMRKTGCALSSIPASRNAQRIGREAQGNLSMRECIRRICFCTSRKKTMGRCQRQISGW